MHHKDNPLFPSIDTPKDVLIMEDMYTEFHKYIEENKLNEYPKDITIEEISLMDDSAKILECLNRYYGTDKWKIITNASEIQSLIDRGNAYAIGVRWRGILVGLITVEIFDVFYKGTMQKVGYGDYLTLHPKFRNKGINMLLIAKAMDRAGELGAQWWFFHTHSKLHVNHALTHTLYNLALTDTPHAVGMSRKMRCALKNPANVLIPPTIEHVSLLNEQPYSIYIKHDSKMLQSMLDYDMVYTDGSSVLRFVSLDNLQNGIPVKSATLVDYVKPNNIPLFNDALNDLREKGFDSVTIINDKTLNDILSTFPFEKNSEMRTYTGNIIPKAKLNEIHLNVR